MFCATIAGMMETTNFYGLDALLTVQLFRGENARQEYRQAFGEQAPPFDPTRAVKRWRGTPADANFNYYVPSGVSGAPLTRVSVSLAPGEAETVNLPGSVEYIPRVVLPSGAFVLTGLGEKQYINPAGLSTEAEALALQSQLEAAGWLVSGIEMETQSGPVAIMYDPGETRRYWKVNTAGRLGSYSVGLMLKDRYTKGINSPGRWSGPGESTSPVWYSNAETPATFSVRPETPAPMRELRPDERVEASPFGVRIYPNAGGSSSEKTTREIFSISAKLDEVLALLRRG